MVQVVEDPFVDKHASSDFRSRNRNDKQKSSTRVSMEVGNLVIKLVYKTNLGDFHYIGLIIHLQSIMVIPVPFGKLTWLAGWKMDYLKMYFLLKWGHFISLPS